MFIRTGDPLADFDRYEAEQQRALNKLPKCDYCGIRITDDYLYDIDGVIVCGKCLKEHFRKPTDDYIE